MNKQKPLALLMATIAILMLAIACGSSDNTTTTPNQGVTSQPVTETTAPSATELPTGTETTPASPTTPPETAPTATPATPASTPWPTPLPTRTIAPTPRNPDQQTATAAAPPPTEAAQEDPTPTPQTADTLPAYDGSSPLIHVYVEEPFILFEEEEGASIKIPLKGLTQDGRRVSIENPSQSGITFPTTGRDHYSLDKDGRYTVLETGWRYARISIELRDQITYANILHIPKENLETPRPLSKRSGANNQNLYCWMDFGFSLKMDTQWFMINLPTQEDQPRLEQIALDSGLTLHGARHYYQGWDKGYSSKGRSYLLVRFSPETCPTFQETLEVIKKLNQTPGVPGIFHLHPEARFNWNPGG